MPYWGSDSRVLLRHVVKLVRESGYGISNVDVTMIAQRPKLKDYIPRMVKNIAEDLQIAENRVNVKATTEEKLGFTGSGEGMACHAVCLLDE
jgi:2-C-methyl-D-erythritol 2,4-cyclodiphosphate synthase